MVRRTLSEILSSDPAIEVIGTASDPFVAADRIGEQVPDVITLDIEMPGMDGLTFLQKIMSQHPIPVIICSSLAEEGAQSTLRALEYGAVDIIAKPRLGSQRFLEESSVLLCEAVKAAAGARLRVYTPRRVIEPKLTADAILSRATGAMLETTEKGGGDRRLHRWNRGAPLAARSPARRRSRHRDRAAYAGSVHPRVRQSFGQPVPHFREGSRKQRYGAARTRV